MANILLTTLDYSGYIALYKLFLFLVFFFLWIWLTTWLYRDAMEIRMGSVFWTTVVFTAGATAALIWMLVPVFIIGMLFYLVSMSTAFIIYVVQRNAKVPKLDQILTMEHIRGLVSKKSEKTDFKEGIVFVTANKNEVPVPQSRTADFFGYRKACGLFEDAMWRRANEVVLSPTAENYNVVYYIDGIATKQPEIEKEQMDYFIHFIKNVADLDVKEKRKPQSNTFEVHKNKNISTWAINTAGSTAGEQIRLKQNIQQGVLKLSEIGLRPEIFENLCTISDKEQGIFIVTGPKKTGVTTTFYALLRNYDAYMNSICTLERKSSAKLPNIIQSTFSLSDTGTTTYAKKLEQIILTNPTVLGVAECEDSETAQMLCRVAESGKVVYVTLEANNVMQALGKWIKLVGNKNVAVNNLLGISNQRLLRKLCDKCKEGYEPNKKLLRKFNIPVEKVKVLSRASTTQQVKRGRVILCDNCQGTGYVGRIPVFEIISLNDELRNFIKQSDSLPVINSRLRSAGMRYLQEEALREIAAGTTAVNEMIRVFSATKKQKRPARKK